MIEKLGRLGRFLFALAMAGFGVQYLVYARLAGPEPGPPWSPGHRFGAYSTAVALIAAAVCIASGKKAGLAAMLLGIMILLRGLFVYASAMAANPYDPGPWTSAFELFAMAGGAWVLAGTMRGDRSFSERWYPSVDKAAVLGRFLFASLLVVVGIQYFMYARFVATLVPAWIPGHLFWAYFVGAAFFAAAVSIATGKNAGLAASLLGLMFFLWVFTLHLPRVVAASHNGKEWTSALVALAMSGAAWVVTGSQRRKD